MKKLFELLERHRLLAPEPGDNPDVGSAGGADTDPAPGAGNNILQSGVDSRLQPSGMTLEGTLAGEPGTQTGDNPPPAGQPPAGQNGKNLLDPTGKPGQDGPADNPAGKDATKTGPDGLDTLAGVEGFEYAEGEIDDLKALCKEHSLPVEAAKAVLDWQAKFAKVADEKRAADLQGEMTEFVRKESDKSFDLVRQEWGTDPAAVAENEAAVARAMRAFADDGFRKLMNESGLCNHPDVVRFVLKVGKAISDDRFIVGRNGGGAKPDLAHRMFPNK